MLVGYGMVDQKAQCWCWYEGNPWQGTPRCCQGPAHAEVQEAGREKVPAVIERQGTNQSYLGKKNTTLGFKQLHKLISPKGQPGSVLHLLLAFRLCQTWHKTKKIK